MNNRRSLIDISSANRPCPAKAHCYNRGMKVSTQRLPESQVLLEIEADAEQMERSLEKAYRRLSQRVEVPGFRKGKAPASMLERHIGRARVVREALDILIPEAYNQAIEEEDVDAIDQPSIELVNDEPLAFKATVPIRPTVELGEYENVRVKREPFIIDESEVDKALEELQHRYAVHEPVERPVAMGDIVRSDVRGVIDGREVYKDDDVELRLRDGATVLLPGIAEGLVGAEKGISKEIPVTVPEGERPLSGKSGTFTLTVKEIKEEQLPALNDEFARGVGEGFASLDALRDRLRNDIRERVEAEVEEAYRDKAVGALVEAAESIEFPPVMVDREIDRLIQDQARHLGLDEEQYLANTRRTREQLHEELKDVAIERVRRSLALTRLAEQEEIKAEDREVDAEVDRLAGSSGQQAEQLRKLFGSPDGRAAIARSLVTRKTMDRLADIASRDGATAPEKKSRRKAAKAAAK
jgi:trigger factor